MSTPFFKRCVANECLKVWGDIFLVIPARDAYFFILKKKLLNVYLKNTKLKN